jgi:hypothetical protein
MNDLEYATFLTVVRVTQKFQPAWREGQTMFNVLQELRPDLADQVNQTELDTFHNDDRVPRLLSWLRTGRP